MSDAVAAGTREDRSGPAVAAVLTEAGFSVTEHVTVPDGLEPLSSTLVRLAEGFCGVIATTGGTGLAERALTPEATSNVVEREAPGLAEAMRAAGPLGRLTRGKAGTLGAALILNLPGSPAGAAEHLAAVIDVLPHAVALLAGETTHH